jgi:REP element-mobilizing transposase RayT
VKLLLQARQRIMPVDVLGLCLMPNHWHLVLRPQADKGHDTGTQLVFPNTG